MALPAKQLCELTQQRILPWWTPQSVAVAYKDKNGKPAWRTPPVVRDLSACATFAVSPLDAEGRCYFIGFDIDNGRRQDVDRLLLALPEGAVPLISASGMKGWHCWLFPEQPIRADVAHTFAKTIIERAGIRCECFPSSVEKSQRLKWPTSIHPQTGIAEEFIEWRTGNELDTRVMLEGLAGGDFRTPIETFYEAMLNEPTKPGPEKADASIQSRETPARRASTGEYEYQCTNTLDIYNVLVRTDKEIPSVQPVSGSDELRDWFSREDVALSLVRKFGGRVQAIGRPFRCILPGHEEEKPSASLWRDRRGVIVYSDFHRRDDVPVFTLPQVYANVISGKVQEWSRCQQGAWGWRALIELDFVKPLPMKAPSLPRSLPEEAQKAYVGFLLLLQTKRLAGLEGPVQFSKRFAGTWCGLSPAAACKALNMLTVVGPLKKHEGSTNTFSVGDAKEEEIEAVYESLGKPSLTRFSQNLVASCLGDDVARLVFRR